MKVSKRETTIVILLTLIGFLIRLVLSADRFFTYDEAWTLALAKADLLQILKGSISAMNYPLHFILVHFWLKINQTPFFLRLSSAILGAATIPVAWLAGKKIFNNRAGLSASFLVAFSPAYIFESTNLRMYSLAILESWLSLYFFWQFLKNKNTFYLVGTGLILALGLYTQQFFVLLVGVLNLFFFLKYGKDKKLLLRWLVTQILILFAFLPIVWLSLTLPGIKISPFSFSLVKIPAILAVYVFSWDAIQIVKLFPFRPENLVNIPAILLFLTLLAAFWQGVKSSKKSKQVTFFYLLIFLPIILVSFVSILFRPIFGVRPFIIFSPAFYLVASLGLSTLKKTKFVLFMIFFLLIIALFLSGEYLKFGQTQESLQPFQFVKKNAQPTDIFIHPDPYTLVLARAYLKDQQFAIIPSWFSQVSESAIGYELISPETLKTKNRFWYFLLDSQYYNRSQAFKKQKEFEEKYQTVITKEFKEADTKVTLFQTRP